MWPPPTTPITSYFFFGKPIYWERKKYLPLSVNGINQPFFNLIFCPSKGASTRSSVGFPPAFPWVDVFQVLNWSGWQFEQVFDPINWSWLPMSIPKERMAKALINLLYIIYTNQSLDQSGGLQAQKSLIRATWFAISSRLIFCPHPGIKWLLFIIRPPP